MHNEGNNLLKLKNVWHRETVKRKNIRKTMMGGCAYIHVVLVT